MVFLDSIHSKNQFYLIKTTKAVRNSWYCGWGIRLTSHGWLFNVSGLSAVEITMKNGRSYRIGTDEPEKLTAVITRLKNNV
ncbi:MAG: hypothetical protein V1664_01635 [Candidatus Uhrbacteria bacterium]